MSKRISITRCDPVRDMLSCYVAKNNGDHLDIAVCPNCPVHTLADQIMALHGVDVDRETLVGLLRAMPAEPS